MYVCLCNGLTDRDIRRTVDAGAPSVAQVYQSLGCGPRCGKCVPLVREALRDSGVAAPVNAAGH